MRFLLIVLILVLSSPVQAQENGNVRLFILSGQSNMGPIDEKVFAQGLQKAFPGDQIIAVKHTVGGKAIYEWYKGWKQSDNLKPPPGVPKELGSIYDVLLEKVKKACDPAKVTTVTLVWLQGETDGRNEPLSEAYEASLKGLIKQFRGDLKREDMRIVLARINDAQNGRPSWDRVRQAQMKVVESDPLAVWIDTDDLNGEKNDVHNDAAGGKQLLQRFIDKAIELQNRPIKK